MVTLTCGVQRKAAVRLQWYSGCPPTVRSRSMLTMNGGCCARAAPAIRVSARKQMIRRIIGLPFCGEDGGAVAWIRLHQCDGAALQQLERERRFPPVIQHNVRNVG